MDAIVIAGGIPQPEDPLYSYSNGNAKALIDIAGKPMVQWVIDALNEARSVDNIVAVGLSSKSGVTSRKPIHFVPNQGRMLSNIVAGVHQSLELNRRNKYVLVVSSDIPTLKGHMVDWLVEAAMQTKDELYYGVCPREVMEKRFPDSKRTYTKLKDMEVCGSDVNVSHVRMATEHLDMWEQLIGNRKSPLRQAGIIGFGTLFSLLTGRLTLANAVARVSQRIGIKARAIVWEYAEPCMDVDKPHQLEFLRDDLATSARRNSARMRHAERQMKKTAGAKSKTSPVKANAARNAARAKLRSKAVARRR